MLFEDACCMQKETKRLIWDIKFRSSCWKSLCRCNANNYTQEANNVESVEVHPVHVPKVNCHEPIPTGGTTDVAPLHNALKPVEKSQVYSVPFNIFHLPKKGQ